MNERDPNTDTPEHDGDTAKAGTKPHDPASDDSATRGDADGAPQSESDAGQPADPPTEIEALRAENIRLEGQWTRAMADLQNFRRRQLRDVEDARRRTVEGFAGDLLPVLDNFQLAMSAADDGETGEVRPEMQNLVEGLKMVQTLLLSSMERHGLVPVAAIGQPFDPNRHEAVGVEAREGVEDGIVLAEHQPGYTLGDRVLRPARVTVSGPGTPSA